MKGIFVGYNSNSKAYHIFDLASNTVIKTRDVEFVGNKFHSNIISSDSIPMQVIETSKADMPNESEDAEIIIEHRKSKHVKKEKDFGPNFVTSIEFTYIKEIAHDSIINEIPIVLNIDCDQQTYKKVLASRDAAFWREEINNEMDLIMSNNIRVLVDLPPLSKVIGYKWIYKKKIGVLRQGWA